MITDGLSYPVSGDDGLKRLLIGSVLGFASVLVLPAFLLLGYSVRVLGDAAHGGTEPPAFDDWGEMFVTGLKATLVAVVYGLVPFGLVVLLAVTILSGAAVGGDAGGLLAGVGLLGVLLSVVASVLVYYLVPAALTNMAVDGQMGAAFDLGRLKRVLLSGDYLLAWLAPVALAVVLNVVTVILVATIVGALLVPIVQFYVQVAVLYMFGRAYGEVTGTAEGRQTPTGAGAGRDNSDTKLR
ncbi:DUF4013 domain-containing protein [Halobaculum sp. MBLA0143]|uniref:DUF4013 domain-containing protein n=1 Tax=Halobaculum sp. MBLA0143 TaxID=3079933 RepID=UPI003526261D